MQTRPQIIILAVIVCALLIAIVGLRQRAARTDIGDEDSEGTGEIYETGGESASFGQSRITAFDELIPEDLPKTTRVNRMPKTDRREDFDTQKRRARGDSSIFGIVRGDERKPLPAATVMLYENDPMTKNPPLLEAISDEQGSYTLDRINDRNMRYILVTKADGYAPEAASIVLGGMPLKRDIQLLRGVEVSGKVVDAQTSAPIPGATVYHPCNRQVYAMLGTVKSGPMGQFTFATVRPGRVRTLAECDGYRRTPKTTQSPDKAVEIAMEPGGCVLRGVTVSRLTEKPESGAKVIVSAGRRITDSVLSDDDGKFEFLELPPGKLTLHAIKGMPSDTQEIELQDGEVREDVTIVLPSELFVAGKVIHAYQGKPLPGIRIHYKSPSGSQSVVSDENGLFGFETLALEEYTVEVHEKNYLPYFDRRATASLEKITSKIGSKESSDKLLIKLRPVRAVAGVVVREDGSRVRGADVLVGMQQGRDSQRILTRSDRKGEFFVNVASMRRGEGLVIARKGDLIGAADTRVPTRSELEIKIKPDRLNGLLVLTDQSPLSGIRVASGYTFGRSSRRYRSSPVRVSGPETYTNARGRFRLPVAANQTVELLFRLPDGNEISKSYDSRSLLRGTRIFVYDPVQRDILSDTREGTARRSDRSDRGRRWGRSSRRRR
jgi:hypothetical protein